MRKKELTFMFSGTVSKNNFLSNLISLMFFFTFLALDILGTTRICMKSWNITGMLRQSRVRASRAQKLQGLRVVNLKNFSRATFFVFWGIQLFDRFMSYLPVKQIWRKSAVWVWPMAIWTKPMAILCPLTAYFMLKIFQSHNLKDV